ncbi:MAG: NAD(P)H-binding protein [Thainema sp.]
MKIFVAGATGAIGCPLMTQLLAQGHEVVAVTRSPERARPLAEQGGESDQLFYKKLIQDKFSST